MPLSSLLLCTLPYRVFPLSILPLPCPAPLYTTLSCPALPDASQPSNLGEGGVTAPSIQFKAEAEGGTNQPVSQSAFQPSRMQPASQPFDSRLHSCSYKLVFLQLKLTIFFFVISPSFNNIRLKLVMPQVTRRDPLT